jgi:DNA-binding MarR family transcriptional regulator
VKQLVSQQKHPEPTVDIRPLAEELRLLVARLVRQMRRNAADQGLTITLRATLATIEREGPMTPSELAAYEGISAPSVTRIVKRLIDEGVIKRRPDPQDGRGYLISLTPKGAAVLRALRNRGSTFLEDRLRNLTPQQLELVPLALEVLEALLDEAPDRQA